MSKTEQVNTSVEQLLAQGSGLRFKCTASCAIYVQDAIY